MTQNATEHTKRTVWSEHKEALGSLFHKEHNPLDSDQNPLQD
jgi:hypothetical protein